MSRPFLRRKMWRVGSCLFPLLYEEDKLVVATWYYKIETICIW